MDNLRKLRNLMKERGIDAYLVTGGDPHGSEYVHPRFRTREFISGFTGSAGVVVVTEAEAVLWTDGRYFIQAERELFEGFVLYKEGLPETTALFEFLGKFAAVGANGDEITLALWEKLKRLGCEVTDVDFIGELWENRPEILPTVTYPHELKYAGLGTRDKLTLVRERMNKAFADSYLVTDLTDVAWLYNLRGDAIPNVPVFFAYAYITGEDSELYVRIDGEYLLANDEKTNITETLKQARGTVFVDKEHTTAKLFSNIKARVVTEQADIITSLKAIKNPIETENIKNCHIVDGAAVFRLIKYVKENPSTLHENEIGVIIDAYRKQLSPVYFGEAFKTIAAYMGNAAQMHYNPDAENSALIENNGFLLVDTGGQYLNGTTDITRTIALGEVSREMKRDFTLVLKSHIALASAKWLHGATGGALDMLPRKVMWDEGLDYKSGTGHGLGYFLSVHEPPQRIKYDNNVVIESGMLTSNEPGIYRENKWGVRTENILLSKDDYTNENGRFMKFETISLAPIDLSALLPEMLTDGEKTWLNEYHKNVYEKLSPYLTEDERKTLEIYTGGIV
ncbi:Xaa-Pro aminopeptidase [Clostridia bacterium]|nr:Xaa-Pro aminopeptidase [Clostridia bacterium]